jgi:hypothetical protein
VQVRQTMDRLPAGTMSRTKKEAVTSSLRSTTPTLLFEVTHAAGLIADPRFEGLLGRWLFRPRVGKL